MTTPTSQRTLSKIERLPLQDLSLNDLATIPYLLTLTEPLHTVLRLAEKEVEATPLPYWFSNSYTINGITATAYEFMYGKNPPHLISHAISAIKNILEQVLEAFGNRFVALDEDSDSVPDGLLSVSSSSLTLLSLESPEQFAMALPNYEGIYDLAKPYLASFASALTNADEATKQFWPTLGNFSFMHNLLILEKIRDPKVKDVQNMFGDVWSGEGLEALYKQGLLYALDITILDCVASPVDNASNRYGHATFTLLRQDAQSKGLEPIAVWVSGKNVDGRPRIYTRKTASPGAWLYALQAAKASIMVCAIWLRHAYLWHVVPGSYASDHE